MERRTAASREHPDANIDEVVLPAELRVLNRGRRKGRPVPLPLREFAVEQVAAGGQKKAGPP